eukprot:PITA_06670
MIGEENCHRDVLGELMSNPGFRFYPTEEELVGFYLKKRVEAGHQLNFDRVIPTLDLYRYDPWELPGLANASCERQWFFFVPRDNKSSRPRPNRLTVSGFWKATGSDRAVRNELLQHIGLKKTLVFYKGRALGGQRTDWIMNEYRLPDFSSSTAKKMEIVLCRIYRKAASWKSVEERSKPARFEKEDPGFSPGDEYEEKQSNLLTINGSCRQTNPMTQADISSLHFQNHGGVCSSDLCKTNNEDDLLETVEPKMFGEDTTRSKTPKARAPPHLELATFSMDFFFSHEQIATPWADNPNAWAPCALLSTP